MWDWLQQLSGGAATFIGSLTGSAIGLIALLLGALFNAHLNRKRDTRLRTLDARSLATALKAELIGIHDTLTRNAEELDNPGGDFFVPDLAHSVRLMPNLLGKFELLDSELIRKVLDVYIVIDQHCDRLLQRGGRIVPDIPPPRRVVLMPRAQARAVALLNRNIGTQIEEAIQGLDAFLSPSPTQ